MNRPFMLGLAFVLAACEHSGAAGGGAGDDGTTDDGPSSGAGGPGGNTGTGGSPPPFEEGGPGCGFEKAAFCETFDQMLPGVSRAGELDGALFSGSRLMPQLPTFDGAFSIGSAKTPQCRTGLPDDIELPFDFLLCDPTSTLASRHLLVVTAAQNYGQNSFRVRRPFDFAGRTGTIRFDAELWAPTILYGFVSATITTDPVGAPSYAIFQNVEGGALPKQGVTVLFDGQNCFNGEVAVSAFIVFREFEQEIVQTTGTCFPAAQGSLNRVELLVSEGGVTVMATAASADGATLPEPQEMGRLDTEMPMTRGYLQLNVHNHATIKYSTDAGEAPLDAWSARFDNVAFDGPVVTGYREYEVSDSLDPVVVQNPAWYGTAVGHYVPAEGSTPVSFSFAGVDLTGITSARLAFNSWMDAYNLSDPTFVFRVNGGSFRERPLTELELGVIDSDQGQDAMALIMDLPLDELVPGANTIDVTVRGAPTSGYPTAIANVDLVLAP